MLLLRLWSIGAATLTQDIPTTVLLVVVMWVMILVYRWARGRSRGLWQMVVSLLVGMSGLLVVSIYDYRYHQPTVLTGSDYIGTGTIVGRVDADTYEVVIDGLSYRYQSQHVYEPDTIVWITARFSPGPIESTRKASMLEWTRSSTQSTLHNTYRSVLYREFDYDMRLKMKGYYGVLYDSGTLSLGRSEQGWSRRVRSWLMGSLQQYRGVSRTTGLTAGMLIGDRSLLSDEEYASFVESSLVHIIAVSGGNIVMLVVFLGAVLFFVPFYLRMAIILCAVIAFAIVVGSDSSVVRATIMGSLTLLALMMGRMIHVQRALTIAAIIMLTINPYYLLYDIGFVFSFAAILGLVRTQHYARKNSRGRLFTVLSPIRNNYMLPSIGASLGVLPFLLYFTQSFNLLSILANLLVLPLVPLVMVSGLVVAVLGHLASRLSRLQPWLVDYIYGVSDLIRVYGVYIDVVGQGVVFVMMIVWLVWLLQAAPLHDVE